MLVLLLLLATWAHAQQHLHPSNYPLCTDEKITTTRFDLDGNVRYVGHFGVKGDVLFALTTTGTLYRSSDGGMNWGTIGASELGVQDALIQAIAPSAKSKTGSNEIKLYLAGSGYLWTTRDGRSFKRLDRVPIYIYPHPYKDEVALASFDDTPCELYLTDNLGETWTKVANGRLAHWINAPDKYGFIHFSSCQVESAITVKTLEASGWVDSPVRGVYRSLYSVAWTGYVTATDNHEQVFFATDDKNELKISRDHGEHWIHAFLPTTDGPPSQYTVYGVDDGAIFLNARAQSSEHPETVGDLFVSGNKTELFSLSLPGNVRSYGRYNGLGGIGDFEKLQSIDGAFIANAYKNKDEKKIQTWMTYDMGGEWRRLEAPVIDTNGVPTQCDSAKGCFLNLFGIADQHEMMADYGGFGRFYSVPSAVGILFGTGNLGDELDLQGDVNTYFSSDAGKTWYELRKKRWAYEIADHGSLLALVPRDEKTNHLLYTWDEGILWRPCNFTSEAEGVHLINLITETSFTSQKFLLYGSTDSGNGVMIGVDFSGMHERECQGADAPGTPTSDYELFTVEDGRECILGMKTEYVRRKQAKKCFNPDEHPVNKRSYKACLCKREDFECGPCYLNDGDTNECKKEENCALPTMEEQCANACLYFAGGAAQYIKVAGDQCFAGEELDSRESATLCPKEMWISEECATYDVIATESPGPSGNGNGGTVFVVLLAVVLIVALVFVAIVCVTKKPAAAYSVLSRCRPGGSGSAGYSKLSLGGDSTSFFDDDELAE